MSMELRKLAERMNLVCPAELEERRVSAVSIYREGCGGSANILYICIHGQCAQAAKICPAVLCTEQCGESNALYPTVAKLPEQLMEECSRWIARQDYVDESISRLNRALLSNRSIAYIAEVASDVFCQPLLIADQSFKLIAGAGYNQINDPFLESIIREGYYPEEYIHRIAEHPEINDMDLFIEDSKIISEPFSPQRYMSKHISVRGKRIAFVTLVENMPFRDGDTEIFAHFCKIIATEMRSTYSGRDPKSSAYEVVLEELINGQLHGQRLHSRLRQVGLEFEKNKRLFVIRAADHTPKRFHYEYLNNNFNMQVKNYHTIVYEQAIVGLVDEDEDGKVFSGENGRLMDFLEHYELVCGVSSTVRDPERMSDFWDQALSALDLGQRLGYAGPVYHHENLGIYHIMDMLVHDCELMDFCASEYIRIQNHDRENGTEYAVTLEAYLGAAQNSLRTAERLGVHRNTVDYRVHRMEELFDFRFDDADMVFAASLTIRVLKYLSLEKR